MQAPPAGKGPAPEPAAGVAARLCGHAQAAAGTFTGDVFVRELCLVKLWENKNAPARGQFSQKTFLQANVGKAWAPHRTTSPAHRPAHPSPGPRCCLPVPRETWP